MKNLLLNAKMIELTDECLLILSKTQNKWFMTSIKNKAAFEMMDGTHSSDEVFSNSVFQSKEEFWSKDMSICKTNQKVSA